MNQKIQKQNEDNYNKFEGNNIINLLSEFIKLKEIQIIENNNKKYKKNIKKA